MSRSGFFTDLVCSLCRRKAALEAFDNMYGPKGAPRSSEDAAKMTTAELKRWRTWMTKDFIPLDREMVNIVLYHAHLIDGDEFPEAFHDMLENVIIWEGLAAQWEDGDFNRHWDSINFPYNELHDPITDFLLPVAWEPSFLAAWSRAGCVFRAG